MSNKLIIKKKYPNSKQRNSKLVRNISRESVSANIYIYMRRKKERDGTRACMAVCVCVYDRAGVRQRKGLHDLKISAKWPLHTPKLYEMK